MPRLEGQAVDQPGFAAIAETNILEADFAARNLEHAGIGSVAERNRSSDGQHAFLHHANILEDVRNLPSRPVGSTGERSVHNAAQGGRRLVSR